MRKINVVLEAETNLLMNSPKSMLEEGSGSKSKLKNIDHKKEAEKLAYRTKLGELYVPAEAIKGCLIKASAYKKLGKYAARPIIAGAVRIEPREILLLDKKGKIMKDYKLDIRTVVIQRNRVPKARPMIENWKLNFDIIYNEDMIADPDIIRTILEEGGVRVGLLDFRPSSNGEFGQFTVTKFLQKK